MMTVMSRCTDCSIYFAASAAVVVTTLLMIAFVLFIIHKKRKAQESTHSEEYDMKHNEEDAETNILYTTIVFPSNGVRKQKHPEEETVYSDVMPNQHKEMTENQHSTSDGDVNKATIKLKPQSRADDSDLYAVVKKPGNAYRKPKA